MLISAKTESQKVLNIYAVRSHKCDKCYNSDRDEYGEQMCRAAAAAGAAGVALGWTS